MAVLGFGIINHTYGWIDEWFNWIVLPVIGLSFLASILLAYHDVYSSLMTAERRESALSIIDGALDAVELLENEIEHPTAGEKADLPAAAAESGAKIMEAGNTLTALGMDRIGQRVRESIVPRWLSKSRLITPEGLRPLVSGARKRLEQARLDVPQMDAGDL